MPNCFRFFIPILMCGTSAYATDFSSCAKISNDKNRLSCFDGIVKDLGITVKQEKIKEDEKKDGLSKWVATDSSSEMDDSKTVTLMLESENTITGFLSDAYRPTLIVRCEENKTDMILHTQNQFNSSGLYSVKATVRLDKGKAKSKSFSRATNGKAIFFKKPIGQIKQMLKAEEMKIQWTPFSANPVIATFNIKGLEDAIKPLRKTCGW